MRVIPPIEITAGMITTPCCAEPDATVGEAVYSGTTYYDEDAEAISTTTHRRYASLAGSSAAVTVTSAAPGVVTWVNHGLTAGTPVAFTNSGGALPSGIVADTVYFVVSPAADTFQFAATVGGAALTTSSVGTGTHTAHANPNRGHDPTTDDGTYWTDAGPTNRWAMFDYLRNTQSEYPSGTTVVITPGERVTGLALVGMIADSVTINVKRSGITVQTYTKQLLTRAVSNMYEYVFAPFRQVRAMAWFDVTPWSDTVFEITLTRAAGNVMLGGVIMGVHTYLGRAIHGSSIDRKNFSTVDRDVDGTATLIPRRTIPATDNQVRCSKAILGDMLALQETLNAVPAFWAALDEDDEGYFEPFLIVGIYTRWTIDADQPVEAIQTLSLEEI